MNASGPLTPAASAGGPAALVDVVRERVLGVSVDPLARAAALGVAANGARVADLAPALGLSDRQLRRRFACWPPCGRAARRPA